MALDAATGRLGVGMGLVGGGGEDEVESRWNCSTRSRDRGA